MRFVSVAVVVALVWSAASFGAVYPWAFVPLMILNVAVGVVGLRVRGIGVSRLLIAAAIAALVAVALQLIPVPRAMLVLLSPAGDRVLQAVELGYKADRSSWHAVSLSPGSTALALGFGVSFLLLFIGTCALIARGGVGQVTTAVVILGGTLAFVGIIQSTFGTEKAYGFWTPQSRTTPFGPFINRNHFAGWMLMAVSLSIGRLIDETKIIVDWANARPGGYRRLLTADRSFLIVLTAAAVGLMVLSIIISQSRSGVACMLIVFILFAAHAWRGFRGASAKWTFVMFLLVVGSSTWAFSGSQAARRFSELPGPDIRSRVGAWRDAVGRAKDFSLTGMGLNTYGISTFVYPNSDPTSHWDAVHNDYLQLAAEGGLLVCLPALAVFAILTFTLARRRSGQAPLWWCQQGALIGLSAIAFQEFVEFSLQIPANAELCVVLAAIAVTLRA